MCLLRHTLFFCDKLGESLEYQPFQVYQNIPSIISGPQVVVGKA